MQKYFNLFYNKSIVYLKIGYIFASAITLNTKIKNHEFN
jgi:hypothetical protein